MCLKKNKKSSRFRISLENLVSNVLILKLLFVRNVNSELHKID